MGKIKIGLIILAPLVAISLVIAGVISAENPLAGKLIALDAGHGGDEIGAQYPANSGKDAQIYEKDVNLAVVYALKQKLEDPTVGVKVVLTRECDETISSRKSRVDMAIEECKSLYGRKCDVLVSVHHNGSTDPAHDGTMVIYNEKQDIPLAKALLEVLAPLTGNNEGLDHGGYGMTVYGHLVSALTEAYYITNDWEATQYLNGTSAQVCDSKSVLIGERITQEAGALYQGLLNYFSAPPPKPGRK
ncbi:MAG: N-acetylmuramoyl-L-alanine amidase [bacterium]|nr:N-acetylmuramoyl-L-alanine amidase [bacterium]